MYKRQILYLIPLILIDCFIVYYSSLCGETSQGITMTTALSDYMMNTI